MKLLKKNLIAIALLTSSLYSGEYFSKVEPFQEYVLKSDVSGKIVVSKIQKEKEVLKSRQKVIQIDAQNEFIELEFLEKKLEIIDELLDLKDEDTKTIAASAAKSAFEKRASRQSYLNMMLTKYDVERGIKRLKRTIGQKSIVLDAKTYINTINVVEDDYVGPGTVLLTYSDINKAKLRVYVNEEDYKGIGSKKIYINSKHYPQYKITKKSLIKDKDKLSMFEIEVVGVKNGFLFGDVVKVEFR